MGCFLACFGSSKEGKRRRKKPANKVQPRDQRNGFYEPLQPGISIKQDRIERPISSIPESRDKLEEQLSFGARKKVTFDLNVQTYEEASTQEITDKPVGGDEKEKERENKEEKAMKEGHSPDNSNTSSSGSYPSNHRYQNCSNSDDEYGDESDSEESDLDDEFYDDDDEGDQEMEGESSESFFSLPTEPKPGGSSSSSSTLLDEKEVNSPALVAATRDLKTLSSNQNARDRSHYVHSVLNPVENLTQWKAVKAKTATTTPLKPPQKENAILEDFHLPFSSEPSFKTSSLSWKTSFDQSSTSQKQEIAVDASLSNWLSSTETTPSIKTSNNNISESAERSSSPRLSLSPRSLEDRPILGALTVEEIKQMNASSSPRRSPTWSPDEMPIIGTVGSYWSHTGQNTNSSSSSCSKGGIPNTTSKYREDKRVNWHSTPFETRLERALNTGVAEAYSNYQTRV